VRIFDIIGIHDRLSIKNEKDEGNNTSKKNVSYNFNVEENNCTYHFIYFASKKFTFQDRNKHKYILEIWKDLTFKSKNLQEHWPIVGGAYSSIDRLEITMDFQLIQKVNPLSHIPRLYNKSNSKII